MELIISFRCDILVQCSVITRIFVLFRIYPYKVFTLAAKLVVSMTGGVFLPNQNATGNICTLGYAQPQGKLE